jgi:transposase
LEARAALPAQRDRLHRLVLTAVRSDPVGRRLMTAPGVGPVTALTFCSAVDDPSRFTLSRAVVAQFGLTPRRYQSGKTDRTGHISKQGDGLARQALYEAANVLLTAPRNGRREAWGVAVAKRLGMRLAKGVVARKLAVVLHRMWRDGTKFRWNRSAEAA